MNYYGIKARTVTPYRAGEQLAGKYVKLNTNENPYPPSPAAERALREFGAEALRRYPRPNADGLREAIAKAEGVDLENVFCGNGSDEVLALCMPAFFDESRPACFADVTYSFYEVFAAFFGIPTAVVPIKEDFSLDLEGMERVDCAGYFIANPNAPTGVGIGRDRMKQFLSSVRGRLVIADEAYMDFFGESLAPFVNEFENLLVVKTFSKSYSLAGIRCGYAVGSPALIEGLFRMKDCFNSYPVDAVCQAVCAAAVGDVEYRKKTAELVCSERERVRSRLLELGFTVPKSSANFLFAGRGKLGGKELYEGLKREGVLVRHWDRPKIGDFVRITVGTREENAVLLEKINLLLEK